MKQKEDADKKAAIVQSKLKECIENGELNSFDRLNTLFNGENKDMMDTDQNGPAIDIDAMDTSDATTITGKKSEKIPVKRSSSRKKKLVIQATAGQSGAKLARKKITYMNRRGQMKKGQKVVKKAKPQQKKKKNLCAF